MAKIIVILALIWLGWMVFKSVLEEIQGRMEDRRAEEEGEAPAQDVPSRSKASLPAATISSPRGSRTRQPNQESLGIEKNELERLLNEARERKRELEREPASKSASSTVRLASAGKVPPKSPEFRHASPEFRPVSMGVETFEEHRHKSEVIQKPIAQVRKQFTPAPPIPRREAPPSATMRRKGKEGAGHEVTASAAKRFAGVSGLDLDDVRSGIIVAEILGPPKGLGGIDSRAI